LRTALVTGACGLLGQHLVNRLKPKYEVIAVDITTNTFKKHENLIFINCDLTDSGALARVLSDTNPDIIYNCAAYTDVDGCEKNRELAYKLNVELVKSLLEAGAERLIQYSTDYVFDGKRGPYDEKDETDPMGYYGETKLHSERLILDSHGSHLIIRTNVLFGTGENVRPNFITWLIDNLNNAKQLRIVTDQYNNPIHADNLAETSIEAEETDLTGVLHLAGDSYLSRFEIAVKTAEHFGLNRKLISPVTTSQLGQIARRPMRGGLKIDLAKKFLKSRLLSFEEGLRLI
jgi:dTDP-4-dehydrorhamnose reductase